MKFINKALVAAAFATAALSASAQEQFFPALSYRVGPYAAGGTGFFGGVIQNWQVVIPDFGTVEGPFLITALEYAGAHDGELTFDIALESAGALTLTVI